MRLADFIESNTPKILAEWEVFAASLLPAAEGLSVATLRDHAGEILEAVVRDLRTPQSRFEQSEKSKGRARVSQSAPETAAQTHAVLRAAGGFSIRQLIAEYRALRASVLRQWEKVQGDVPDAVDVRADVGRFNEAIDQAIAESVDCFANEVDRWRAVYLGVLSHDLRNPLNAVLTSSHLISSLSAGTTLSQHAERLERSCKRMAQLLDDLLDYNRTALGVGVLIRPAPLDLATACLEEIEVLRGAVPEATIEFATAGATEGCWDSSRIKQVLSNLVINATKYGDPKGIVRVGLRGDDVHVDLTVENTGPCIPADLMKMVFEPLRRHANGDAYGDRKSLGLGLFIVRQIALAHGGEVRVESADRRTKVTVTLPRGSPDPEDRLDPSERSRSAEQPQGLRMT